VVLKCAFGGDCNFDCCSTSKYLQLPDYFEIRCVVCHHQIPGIVIVVVISILVSFYHPDPEGAPAVGHIPGGLPSPLLPNFVRHFAFYHQLGSRHRTSARQHVNTVTAREEKEGNNTFNTLNTSTQSNITSSTRQHSHQAIKY
jgi:hypothetical protein